MKGVYNKEALNQIAAQDRLDRMIVLVSPGAWISIIGGFAIIGALIAWGFLGKLPASVETQGMYMNSDGVSHLYSEGTGFVTDVYVNDGDTVKTGDLIATLGTEDDYFEIRQLDTRIQYVENMTFDSELDEVTSDTEKMASIKMNAKSAGTTAKKTEANLELKKEKLADAEAKVKEKEELMLEYKEKFYATLAITDQQEQLAYTEANDDYSKHFSLYEQYKTTYISAQETYNLRKTEFDEKYASFDQTEATESELATYNAALADVEAAQAAAGDAKYFMEQEEEKLKSANSALDTARKAYLEYLNNISGTAATNTISSTEYSEALQDYETAKSQYKSLVDEIDNLELQAVLDQDDADLNVETYEQQFDNEKSIVLHDLNAQRDSLLNKTDKSEIVAASDGEIYDVTVSVGDAVNRGTEIAKVLDGDLENECVICYPVLTDVKKVKEGMEAHIYPTSVDREEYGHIEGYVSQVQNHVASNHDMLQQLGEESLVNQFMANGAVQEMRIVLEKDPNTQSGYKWSSNKGADVELSAGTMVTVTIITEDKRPIDVLIPYLKSKLNFESDSKTDSSSK